MSSSLFLPGTIAFVVAAGLVGAFIPLLRQANIVDSPNARSSHVLATPCGAGIAIILAVAAATFTSRAVVDDGARTAGVFACAVALGVVGFIDDVSPRSCLSRLGAQFSIGGVFAFAVMENSTTVRRVVAVFFVVAFVNAFNFMDGVNGLAGLSAIVLAGSLLIGGAGPGGGVLAVAVLGGAVGFLPWNFPVARIFLGDSGSYFLGGMLSFTALSTEPQSFAVLLPLCVFSADVSVTLAYRAWNRKRLLEAHSEHAYQRIARRFNSHTPASLGFGVLLISAAGLAAASQRTSLPISIATLAAAGLAVTFVVYGRRFS